MKLQGKALLIAGVIAALALAGGTTVAVIEYNATRGLRNNNPGNIRKSATAWQGLSPTQTDASFFQFISPEYGIRALATILGTYMKNYGLVTVSDIISRWAPPVR